MGKRLFFIFVVVLVIGSAVLLNQAAPVPRSNTTVNNPPQTELPNTTAAPARFSITITSNPPDANVYLDDVSMGKTPVTLAALDHNSYSLRLTKTGFSTDVSTLVPAASNGLVAIKLTPIASTATPDLTTNGSGLDNPANIDALFANDPQIPVALLDKVTVPDGFRFPDNVTDISQRINLEVIPPDPSMPLTGLDRSNLIARLAELYYYDSKSVSVKLDDAFTPQTVAVFNGTAFDPINSKMTSNQMVVWYNNTASTCQLRTDPQSPVKINQLVPAGKSWNLSLSDKGIYIFYCQGAPGPTHTLVVS